MNELAELRELVERLELVVEELTKIIIAAAANRDGPIAGSFGGLSKEHRRQPRRRRLG